MLQILGSRYEHLNFAILERYSRAWIRSAWSSFNLRDCLEAAVIASHCRRQNRVDLACHVSLMLLRSTLATIHGQEHVPETAAVALATAKAQFRYYARLLWADCRNHYLDPDEMIQGDPTPAGFATYPVRCLTAIEILGMLGLLEFDIQEGTDTARELAIYIGEFIRANAGATHPISDRWSVSLVPAALLFDRFGMAETTRVFLRSCTKWVTDYYDAGGFGLAGPHASPDEEVLFLLSPPFEGIQLRRRSESYISSTILDLASVLEDAETYDVARNEFLAVDIVLPVIETDDGPSQYSLHVGVCRFEPSMPYQDYWEPVSTWKHAPHHHREIEDRYPSRVDGAWSQLALSCVLRDRHCVTGWRILTGRAI